MNVQEEKSLLMVKPDGIEKGLVPYIRELIFQQNLTIEKEKLFRFDRALAEIFYKEYKKRDCFLDLIEFITSQPVVIFFVSGENTVVKIRKIVGKRYPPSGIRKTHAESIVRNIAHGPDSPEAARREIQLILQKEKISKMKRIFAIGGLSESGKSTVGKRLDSKGIVRWKFVAFYKEIMKIEEPRTTFNEWQDQTIKGRPEWLWERFVDALKLKAVRENIQYCGLESLYDPGLTKALRRAFGQSLVVVYVDIPLDIRLQRQIIRQNLLSIEEAKAYLLPRDKDKIQWGGLQIKELADVIIDNSGTIDVLYHQIDEMVRRFCPELCKV